MATVEIKIPTVGESINEATIGRWNFKSGDWVEKDAVVLEIETEKATMEVSAPASGKLTITANQGQTVAIGAIVGSVDTAADKSAAAPAAPTKPPPGAKPASGPRATPPPSYMKSDSEPAPTAVASSTAPAPQASAPITQTSTPAASGGMETVELRGLGPAARKAVREGKMAPPSSAPAPGQTSLDPRPGEQERKPMSTIRRKIAERLLHSQQSTATLTTFNEIDMTNILSIRKSVQDQFTAKHGVKLGFMSFFTKAVCYAASQVPVVNAFIDGHDVLYNKHVHAGIAVSTDRGLVVPVLRYADTMNYAQIEKGILDLAERARTGRLGIEEMMGGTFTITNGGVFGSLLSTPILNPPQSAILGMHKTEHRPVAIDAGGGKYSVEVRPMMYLAMSYDHRLIDGRDSVTFLVKVKEYLETVTKDQVG
ncbi:MAG TPA: 2-oxoglutarate dehydrogenase complex dihydrolipoyllysine-residue succinyltransferase [Bdellovibrionales bacterium]|nr:2-oxoglutarate dehydrogenase complex dihydrolipoyllysine-residue succinyltransferase [Bdellovibrionales bacterium]